MTKPKFDRLLMTIIVLGVALIVAAPAGELVRNQLVRGKGRYTVVAQVPDTSEFSDVVGVHFYQRDTDETVTRYCKLPAGPGQRLHIIIESPPIGRIQWGCMVEDAAGNLSPLTWGDVRETMPPLRIENVDGKTRVSGWGMLK